jgi:hypothetical protein
VKPSPWKAAALAAGLSIAANAPSPAAVITFEGLLGSPETNYRGTPSQSGFTVNGATFTNSNSEYFWEGFGYSNTTDRTTPGYTNDFSAYATSGGGAGGSSTYGISFVSTYVNPLGSVVTYASAIDMTGQGMSVTNTTYAVLSMMQGDDFAKKFGGASGNDADWFMLTISGYLNGIYQNKVDFYLADFRFTDNSQDYMITDWTHVDFSDLGVVDELRFSMSSSDSGQYGMNTPAYFAFDNLATVPEASTLSLVAMGGWLLTLRRRKQP